MIKTILWDWNGTLFNDVDCCIEIINEMLEKRKLPYLTHSRYQAVFTFPVKEYYEEVGFNFKEDSFEDLSQEYMQLYHPRSQSCQLSSHAETVLSQLSSMGFRQILFSASKKENLLDQLRQFNISSYFDDILGLDDIYAHSKIEMGMKWIESQKREEVLLIGDTLHDAEAALAMRCSCVLYGKGHQDKGRLDKSRLTVIEDLKEFPAVLRQWNKDTAR